MSRRLHADLGAQGLRDFPELRGSHRRILQMIPPHGIRITDLALLAGMTKQALGEFVDWLERSGFVASGRDPADGRGPAREADGAGRRRRDHRAAGDRGGRAGLAAEIGDSRYEAMKQAMRELGRPRRIRIPGLTGEVLPGVAGPKSRLGLDGVTATAMPAGHEPRRAHSAPGAYFCLWRI